VLFSTPLLRAVNLSIAVLLAALLGAIYWFAWRTLPETSGDIKAPIQGKATIARDALGVPHIQAASWEDAIFLEGYVMAQDRMWQLDGARRLAAGELAEIAGPTALEGDREARRLRLGRLAEMQEQTLPPSTRRIFSAFARGINYYLETHRGKLSVEFTLLNYEPRPWRLRDSLLMGLEMSRELTSSWRDDLEKGKMLQAGDPQKIAYLYPPRTGGEVQPGSNAWVISGAHTASGKPILANDTHLNWAMPTTWYELQMTAPDLDVEGFTLPGLPGVIIGHNRNIAWGVTNLGFDAQDLHLTKINMQNGRYESPTGTQQATLERDAISVRGAAPVESLAWVTHDGPVFLNEGNSSYVLRWAAAAPEPLDYPFLDIDRASNWDEFNQALERFPGPSQNFVYADTQGNIGYHVAGHLPIRKNCVGDVPSDPAAGECAWEGYIPYKDLPQAFNPPSGIIVTANQNPFPADYEYPVNGKFSPKYRHTQIRALLSARDKWQPAEILSVQKDVYSAYADFLARQTVAAFDKHPASGQVKDAVDQLRNWNGQMEKGTAAPMIVALLDQQLRKSVAAKASPARGTWETSFLAPEVVEKLFRERPEGWFADYDAQLLSSLGAALADGEKIQGSKVSRWDYGQLNQLTIRQPVLGQLPLVGKYLNVGPVSMSGSGTTVKQTTQRLGPSERMIIDLSDFDKSLANLTIGESGHVLSGHYKDQWNAYWSATSFPMEFANIRAKQVLTVTPAK
jgi:penicillin G amidase